MDVLHVELAFEMGQSIEHLYSTLAIADVEDFFDVGMLLNHFDVGGIIIEAHVSPCV